MSISFMVVGSSSNWSVRVRMFTELVSVVCSTIPVDYVETFGSCFPYLHVSFKKKHFPVVIAELHNSGLFSVFVENGELIYTLK